MPAGASSVEEIAARLCLWAGRAERGFARVTYVDEASREAVERRLAAALAEAGVAFHRFEVPQERLAVLTGDGIVDGLGQLGEGAVSIAGLHRARPENGKLDDLIAVLGWRREALAILPLCQIWWMTPETSDLFVQLVPDLESWFMVKLSLAAPPRAQVEPPPDEGRITRDPDEARATAKRLTDRAFEAMRLNQPVGEIWRSLAAPALEALAEAGLAEEGKAAYAEFRERLGADTTREYAEAMLAIAGHLAEWWETSEAIANLASAEAIWLSLGADEGRSSALVERARILISAGDFEGALKPSREAVAIGRDLSNRNPGAGLLLLAGALQLLAIVQSGLDRREEALQAAEESSHVCRQLAQFIPDAFLPDLMASLTNLSIRFFDLGRPGEALAAVEESVAIHRKLADRHPEAQPHMAGLLNSLANMLSDLGRPDEALVAAEESSRVYRQLAEQRPDAFLAELAMSLNSLAKMLSDLGRPEEALAAVEEGAAIYRELARPDALRHDVAMSANNRASVLAYLGRREESLAAAQEAVALYRRLAQFRPDAFRPNLAMAANTMAATLSNLGRHAEALAAAQEAIALYRELAQLRPEVFRPNLAMSLNNLATMLGELDRAAEALAAAQEAISLYRQLAEVDPDVHRPDLARCLATKGEVLQPDQPSEALESVTEALRILLPFFARVPQAHASLMQAIRELYIKTSKAADIQADETLLAQVDAVFERRGPPPES